MTRGAHVQTASRRCANQRGEQAPGLSAYLVQAEVRPPSLIQVAEYYARPDLDGGHLVEVLADYKTHAYDISVVFHQRKRIAPRLRVFVDFLVDLFDPPPWAGQRTAPRRPSRPSSRH